VSASASAIDLSTLPSGSYASRSVTPALPNVAPAELAAAYDACREITRSRARNFYYGLRLTPEPRRSAIYSIYAWMRAADDAADARAPIPQRRSALAHHRALTEQLLGGGDIPTGTGRPGDSGAIWLAFAATVRSYPVHPQIFRDMLDGLDDDLAGIEHRTDEDLSRYCYRVAGTAGLACVWIWGLRKGADPVRAHDLALRRGQAFQRTNILRDFSEDYADEPRRVYLPADAFARHGLTPDAVRSWTDAARCRSFIEEQASIARAHYTASEPLLDLVDEHCRPTLWAMTRIYAGILERIERDPSCVVGPQRVRVPSTVKASIAISAALRARVARW
jgi:15-cis-phytoene synthase